jgi:MFS family permease
MINMINLHKATEVASPLPWRRWLKENALGFLYWMIFLLVLEPGNILRAIQAGHAPGFGHELVRIVVASCLSATVTPLLLMLSRRFPITGRDRWRHVLISMAAAAGLACILILATCFLAAWIFAHAWFPSMAEVDNQLANNWLLLIYAIGAFLAIAQTVLLFHRIVDPQPPIDKSNGLERVSIKTRTGQSFLGLSTVDWIETQGNYLALHVGSESHLIRETLVNFESQLDARRFVRIHRRVIVAIDRIREMQAVTNGDTILRLENGCELRASRNYRESIRERWVGAQ